MSDPLVLHRLPTTGRIGSLPGSANQRNRKPERNAHGGNGDGATPHIRETSPRPDLSWMDGPLRYGEAAASGSGPNAACAAKSGENPVLSRNCEASSRNLVEDESGRLGTW